ncbi:MAG: LysR substrate-binding domain-containing protein [Hyphomicrobium sp.]|nr:LysR substrate-binding domain-containing protein [Hyphomicrobium sp.]
MLNVTLKQLRYFDALSRERHFGRAAEACAVTQPALSMQISELEHSLGLTLVERTRTGIQLTPKGEEISRRASRILGDCRDLVAFAHHSSRTLTGALRLGVIPSVAPYMLPPLLPVLRQSYPDLELHVRETQTAHLIEELLDGKIDLVLLALPIKHSDLEEHELFEDRFLLALPRQKKVAGRLRATKDMIENERLLLLEEGHCLRDQALTYCNLKQVDTLNTFGASSLATIVEMVAAGYGITLLPEMSLAMEERGRELTVIRFAEPEPMRRIGLIWRATSPRKGDFAEFGRLVKQAWESGPLASAMALLAARSRKPSGVSAETS